MAFGQTRQINAPAAKTCKGAECHCIVGLMPMAPRTTSWWTSLRRGNICAGTWNRNSGGGIADYTICNFPKPVPKYGRIALCDGIHHGLGKLRDLKSRAGLCSPAGEFDYAGALKSVASVIPRARAPSLIPKRALPRMASSTSCALRHPSRTTPALGGFPRESAPFPAVLRLWAR